MNSEVQHLDKNIRYRILIINGEQYILDMERSFWKIIFPFFFWMFPTPVFKVEDPTIVEQLKEPEKTKSEGSLLISLGGIAYVIGILLAPLMDYFEIQSSPLVNTLLLIVSLIFVAFLYFSISNSRKNKLNHIVEVENLEKSVVLVRPKSFKHIFKVSFVFIWFLGLSLLFYMGFIETRNIIVLIVASGMFFVYLLSSRITVEEGYIKVKFKGYNNAV